MRISKALSIGVLLFAGTATPQGSALSQEVCVYASKAYAKGLTGCFRKVALECVGFNDWREVGSCSDAGTPSGNDAPGLPDSMDGPLCDAAGYYSPDSEGCIAGFYQRCEADGRWNTSISPIDGAACP